MAIQNNMRIKGIAVAVYTNPKISLRKKMIFHPTIFQPVLFIARQYFRIIRLNDRRRFRLPILILFMPPAYSTR